MSGAQVQANGHHASDASILLSRATAPASISSRAASPAPSLASASSMLTSGSTAQQQQLLPKLVKVRTNNSNPLYPAVHPLELNTVILHDTLIHTTHYMVHCIYLHFVSGDSFAQMRPSLPSAAMLMLTMGVCHTSRWVLSMFSLLLEDKFEAHEMLYYGHAQVRCVLQHQENGVSAAESSQQSTGLPTSLVYRMSCEHFSRPLLVQQVCHLAFLERHRIHVVVVP